MLTTKASATPWEAQELGLPFQAKRGPYPDTDQLLDAAAWGKEGDLEQGRYIPEKRLNLEPSATIPAAPREGTAEGCDYITNE